MKTIETLASDAELIEVFLAVEGIPVDPTLPAEWDCTPNEDRPACHRRLWGRPYIVTQAWFGGSGREQWLTAWPSGTRYDVRCLDGGAWDRSTWCGSFATLEEAMCLAEAIK